MTGFVPFRYMGIGLSTSDVNLNRLPGWDKGSYGYHGDDGHSFCSSGSGIVYGPTFTTGDYVGCCVNFLENSCFYTRNGYNIGKHYPLSLQSHAHVVPFPSRYLIPRHTGTRFPSLSLDVQHLSADAHRRTSIPPWVYKRRTKRSKRTSVLVHSNSTSKSTWT